MFTFNPEKRSPHSEEGGNVENNKNIESIDQKIADLQAQIAQLQQEKELSMKTLSEKQEEYGVSVNSVETMKFPIWKTIELSTKTPEQYTKELTDKGNQIDRYAQQILNKIEALPTPEQINLVSFSVEQLGFPNGATLQEIYDKAQSMGLELCPPQVGPELRLSYTNQPNYEYLRIAMEPITDVDGGPELFSVDRTGSGPWLSYDGGHADGGWWHGFYRFVFRASKS